FARRRFARRLGPYRRKLCRGGPGGRRFQLCEADRPRRIRRREKCGQGQKLAKGVPAMTRLTRRAACVAFMAALLTLPPANTDSFAAESKRKGVRFWNLTSSTVRNLQL